MGRFYQFDVGLVLSHELVALHLWGVFISVKLSHQRRNLKLTFHMGLHGNKILEKGVCIKICICS